MLRIDNGRDYLAKDVKEACVSQRIRLDRCPRKQPWMKGLIERFQETMETGLAHKTPGTTFSNSLQKGDYDSLGQASLRISDFYKVLMTYLLDIYAQKPHTGINDVPARAWAAGLARFSPRLPDNMEELPLIFCRSDKRTVQREGVELYNLFFNSDELAPLREKLKGKQTKIKFHASDFSKVYVYDPFERIYIIAPAQAQAYVQGLSLWKHKTICKYVRDE